MGNKIDRAVFNLVTGFMNNTNGYLFTEGSDAMWSAEEIEEYEGRSVQKITNFKVRIQGPGGRYEDFYTYDITVRRLND